MDYYCESCHMVQYKEDLGMRADRWDEPGFLSCGFCGSDEIMELTQEAVAAQLYATIKYIAESAFDNPHVVRNYTNMASALTEWLEDMA